MTMDTNEIEQAVEQRRVWLQGQLDTAAARFGVEPAGEVVNTFDMRSAGAPARDGDRFRGHPDRDAPSFRRLGHRDPLGPLITPTPTQNPNWWLTRVKADARICESNKVSPCP
jgi:hypothetical protein